jgi:mannosyltransferase
MSLDWLRRAGDESKFVYLWVAAASATGAFFRWYGLSEESLWIDETITYWFVTEYSYLELVTLLPQKQPHLPLYYVLLKAWLSVPGVDGVGGRWLSVFFGVLLIPAVFMTARWLVDDWVAAFASLISAVAPVHVYYSQELRMYSLFALLVCLSWWTLLRYLLGGRQRRDLAVHATVVVLMSVTHYYTIFFVAGQTLAVWLFKYAVDKGSWWKIPLVYGVVCSPMMSLLAAKVLLPHSVAGEAAEVGHIQTAPGIIETLKMATFDMFFYQPLSSAVGTLFISFALAVPLALGMRELWADGRVSRVILPWTAAPVLAAFAASHLVRPILMPRYIMGISIPLYIGASLGLMEVDVDWKRSVFTVILILSLVGSTLALAHTHQKPGMDDAEEYVSKEYSKDEVVLLDRDNEKSPISYYFSSGYETVEIPRTGYNPQNSWREANIGPSMQEAKEYDGIFFVAMTSPKTERKRILNRLCSDYEVVDYRAFKWAVVFHLERAPSHTEEHVFYMKNQSCGQPGN